MLAEELPGNACTADGACLDVIKTRPKTNMATIMRVWKRVREVGGIRKAFWMQFRCSGCVILINECILDWET